MVIFVPISVKRKFGVNDGICNYAASHVKGLRLDINFNRLNRAMQF